MQASGKYGGQVQQLAVQLLGSWANASVLNCGKIAVLRGGQALASIAEHASQAPVDRSIRADLIRTMALLARDCPLQCVSFAIQAECM